MKQTKLTFASENLVVDYLSLNIQGWVDPEPMAKYFFQAFGFNSTIVKRIHGKWKPQVLKYDSRNRFQVSFRQYDYDPESKSFWVGIQIHFSGKNAAYLYSCIKEDRFDWNLLELQRISLGRFDLHYFRKSEARDSNQEIEDFMEKSCQKIGSKSKRIQSSWTRTPKGRLLRIGSRSSSNFYRVYQKEKDVTYDVYYEVVDGLQFELELKNELVKSFQEFLFANQIEEFEDRLSQHFLKKSVKYLVLNFCYTDWLVKLLRKIVQRPKFNPGLVTDYLGKSKLNSFPENKVTYQYHSTLFFNFLKTV